MQIEQLKPIIEAALLAASQPLTVNQLGDLFVEDDQVDREAIARALEALAGDCAGRGVELREVASGFRYQVRQDVHPWVSRMWTEKPSRYSRALLETLALIAYRQPITRPEIEQIRGVVVSSNIVKTLEEREWIRVVGHRDVPGKPALFGTTRAFLDYFGLKSLDELPPLSEIRDMEDPQLRFEEAPLPPPVVKNLPIDPDEEPAEVAGGPSDDASDSDAPALASEDQHAGDAPASLGEDEHAGNDATPDADASDSHAQASAGKDGHAAGDVADADPSAGEDPSIPGTAPGQDAPAPLPSATADEAAAPADVEPDAAEQDLSKEYRA